MRGFSLFGFHAPASEAVLLSSFPPAGTREGVPGHRGTSNELGAAAWKDTQGTARQDASETAEAPRKPVSSPASTQCSTRRRMRVRVSTLAPDQPSKLGPSRIAAPLGASGDSGERVGGLSATLCPGRGATTGGVDAKTFETARGVPAPNRGAPTQTNGRRL
jgi:hypothetical protein